MSKSDLTAEIMAACNLLKQHGLHAAAKLLAKAELAERKPKRQSKRKAWLTDPLTGRPMSGGAFGFDLSAVDESHTLDSDESDEP